MIAKNQVKEPKSLLKVIEKTTYERELEEITCLRRVSRLLMVIVVDPSKAATTKARGPNLEEFSGLKDPSFSFGGRVGTVFKIMSILMIIFVFNSKTIIKIYD